ENACHQRTRRGAHAEEAAAGSSNHRYSHANGRGTTTGAGRRYSLERPRAQRAIPNQPRVPGNPQPAVKQRARAANP
ncbi:MAG: hypothetical protein WAN93_06125, partial [Solirubrobacteraceae bacterium]